MDPAPALSVRCSLLEAVPHICRDTGGAGEPRAVCAARGWRRGAVPAPFPFLRWQSAPSGRGGRAGLSGLGARLRQFTPSITRWHSHPGAPPAPSPARVPDTLLQPAFLTLHHRPCRAPPAQTSSFCLLRGKKFEIMFPKLLEISFYQALTLICLLSYQAPVKARFSLLQFMPAYDPSLNKAFYSRCLCFKCFQ